MFEKYHKISSAFASILLIVIVQLFSTPEPVFRFLFPALIIFLIGVGIYATLYLKRVGRFNWWSVIRTLLVFVAWVGLFLIIPSSVLRGIFLLVGLPVLYYVLYTTGNTGEQLLFNELVISAFGMFMLLAGFAQYFVRIGSWYVLVTFALTTLLCRATLELTPHGKRSKWLGSVIIGLVLAELFWALSFLPLHYSVLGFVLFVIFYALWSLYYYYLFNHLTVRKVQFHLGLSFIFIILVLLTTPWGIIS
jgi:hypothetical protein